MKAWWVIVLMVINNYLVIYTTQQDVQGKKISAVENTVQLSIKQERKYIHYTTVLMHSFPFVSKPTKC
jgi:regulatory protein YycI of two-component signal transduction system YycFG